MCSRSLPFDNLEIHGNNAPMIPSGRLTPWPGKPRGHVRDSTDFAL